LTFKRNYEQFLNALLNGPTFSKFVLLSVLPICKNFNIDLHQQFSRMQYDEFQSTSLTRTEISYLHLAVGFYLRNQ